MTYIIQEPFGRSYWVVAHKFLAGAYPGSQDCQEAHEKIRGLVQCGIRRVINLMEENETNYRNERFVLYEDILGAISDQFGVIVDVTRHPIRDLTTPSEKAMIQILDRIDLSVSQGLPVYVHCWGGVGRTGTVVGCYLMRHGLAIAGDVLERIAELRSDEAAAWRRSPETDRQRRMVQSWLPGK